MSVAGLWVVYISGQVWSGEVAEPMGTGVPVRAHLFPLARPLPRSKPNQIYIPPTILPLTYFIHLPMKMEPIVSFETSAIKSQTPGNYPKRNKLHLQHGESLKRKFLVVYLIHFSISLFLRKQNLKYSAKKAQGHLCLFLTTLP